MPKKPGTFWFKAENSPFWRFVVLNKNTQGNLWGVVFEFETFEGGGPYRAVYTHVGNLRGVWVEALPPVAIEQEVIKAP